MAKTVNGAFNSFMKDYVNLAKERTEKARNSRDALIDKINNLDNFLPLDSNGLAFFSVANRVIQMLAVMFAKEQRTFLN